MSSDTGSRTSRRSHAVPVRSRKRAAQEVLGREMPVAARLPTLHEWCSYAFSGDDPVELSAYVCRGNRLLTREVDSFCRNPRTHIRRAVGDGGMSQTERLAAMVDAMLECETRLYDIVFTRYEELGAPPTSGRSIGWSTAAIVFGCASRVRYQRWLMRAVLSRVERDGWDATMRDNSMRISVPMGALVALPAEFQWLCPEPLRRRVLDTDARTLVPRALVLWPQLAQGRYTQSQVWLQLTHLATQWFDLDLEDDALATLLSNLQLRLAELCAGAWPRALYTHLVDVDHPLDMGAVYELPARFGGIPPEDAGAQLTANKLRERMEGRHDSDQWRHDDMMACSRAFVGEVLGMLCPMRRELEFVARTVVPARIDADAQQQTLEQLALAMTAETRALTYATMLDATRARMAYERHNITDDKTRNTLITALRRDTLPLGIVERFAFDPENMFLFVREPERLEQTCLPRPVLLASTAVGAEIEMGEFEQSPYPARARNIAAACVVQTTLYMYDPEYDWRGMNVRWDSTAATQRMSSDSTPFVLALCACIYVRREERFYRAESMYEAFLMWLMFFYNDHRCERVDELGCTQSHAFLIGVWDSIVQLCEPEDGGQNDASESDVSDSDYEMDACSDREMDTNSMSS